MLRAIYHALLDEGVPQGTGGGHIHLEHVGNLAGTMGTRAKFRHRTHVLLFGGVSRSRRSESWSVKGLADLVRRAFRIVGGDRADFRHVHVRWPTLEENTDILWLKKE